MNMLLEMKCCLHKPLVYKRIYSKYFFFLFEIINKHVKNNISMKFSMEMFPFLFFSFCFDYFSVL